ncbi:17095_t:CDS:2 [Acaulospora colombiana]|uniref:17095_t:CDS:1 n=1 Tax=Acaulospora colombiana TaxID=27376 RepID=A0ACA9KB73_9GLOM|nr:17095_t:CDS:2 [Acaulospora colombiana]
MTKRRKHNTASVWEAIAILDEKYDREKECLFYLIQWAGKDENGNTWSPTWEPDVNCGSALIDEWKERKKKGANEPGSSIQETENTMEATERKSESERTLMFPMDSSTRKSASYSPPLEPAMITEGNKKKISIINPSSSDILSTTTEKKQRAALDKPSSVRVIHVNGDSEIQEDYKKPGDSSTSVIHVDNDHKGDAQQTKDVQDQKGIQNVRGVHNKTSVSGSSGPASSSTKSNMCNNSSSKSLGKRPALPIERTVTIFKCDRRKKKYKALCAKLVLEDSSDSSSDCSEQNVTKSPILDVQFSTNINDNGSQQFCRLNLPSRSGRLFIAKKISPQIDRTIPNKRSKSVHTPTNTDIEENLSSLKKPRYEESYVSEEEETIISGQVLTENLVRPPIESDNVIMTRTLHTPASSNSELSSLNVINDPKMPLQRSSDTPPNTLETHVHETSNSKNHKSSNSPSQHRANTMEIVSKDGKSPLCANKVQSPIAPRNNTEEKDSVSLQNRVTRKSDGKSKIQPQNLLEKSRFQRKNSHSSPKKPTDSTDINDVELEDEEEVYIMESQLVPSNAAEPKINNSLGASRLTNSQNKSINSVQNIPVSSNEQQMSEEIMRLNEEIDRLSKENVSLKKTQEAEEIMRLHEEIDRLSKENVSLKKTQEELEHTKKLLTETQIELEEYKAQGKNLSKDDQESNNSKSEELSRSQSDDVPEINIALHGMKDFVILQKSILSTCGRIEEISSKFDELRSELYKVEDSLCNTSAEVKKERLRRKILEKELELAKETSIISKDTIKFLSELSFSIGGLSLENYKAKASISNSTDGIDSSVNTRTDFENASETNANINIQYCRDFDRSPNNVDSTSVDAGNSQHSYLAGSTVANKAKSNANSNNINTASPDVAPMHALLSTISNGSSPVSPTVSTPRSMKNASTRRIFTAISGFPSISPTPDQNSKENMHAIQTTSASLVIEPPSSNKISALIRRLDEPSQNGATNLSRSLGANAEHISCSRTHASEYFCYWNHCNQSFKSKLTLRLHIIDAHLEEGAIKILKSHVRELNG